MADRRRYERDLFHDLTTFRVETLVLAESGTRLVLPSPVRRGTPPTSPEQLIEEVAVAGALWVRSATNDRVTGFENREFDADELYRLAQTAEQMARSTRNPEVRAVRAPEVDPEVAARQAQALRLAAALRETALGSRFRRGRARGFSGGAARVEHRAMRQLARHWELGSRTVWGRTVMRMDGDTTTVFRPHTSESDAIQAAHIRIATAAMDHWQFLLSAFNDVLVLLASFLRRTTWRPSLPRRRHIDRRAQQPSVQRLSPQELLGRLVRLFGIGRVVFESVGSSGACEIRTMVVASGDVEVSIRDSSVEGHVLITHIETVATWLAEVSSSLCDWRWILTWIPVLVGASGAAIPLFVGAGSLVCQLVAGAAATITPMVLAGLARWLLRRRLLRVFDHPQDEVELLAP